MSHNRVGLLAAILTALFLTPGCKRSQPIFGSGDEWLSLTPNEKRHYVAGFTDGWGAGSSETCAKIDEFTLLDTNKTKEDDTIIGLPSAKCRHTFSGFSKVQLKGGDASTLRGATEDVSAYTNVLDDFYRHPECRTMPYSILLSHMNDGEFKSGEDLFKFVRSGPNRGFFSGFDGIEKCLPGYR